MLYPNYPDLPYQVIFATVWRSTDSVFQSPISPSAVWSRHCPVPAPDKKPRPMTGIFGLQRKSDSDGQTKTDGNEYDPSKKKYHPVNDAIWKDGQKWVDLHRRLFSFIAQWWVRIFCLPVLFSVLIEGDLSYIVDPCVSALAYLLIYTFATRSK